MKLAIHHREGSFSSYWIEYCIKNNIPYKIVNAYDDDIIKQLDDCDAFMWHHHHNIESDQLIAQQILSSIEQSGKSVFPNFKTAWHFDDKLGQKYLLESIKAPLVHSFAFFDRQKALSWIQSTTFPKVFKLRGGAGSSNVRLVKNKKEAIKLVKKCFGVGFKHHNLFNTLKYQWEKYNSGFITLQNMFNFSLFTIKKHYTQINNREHGYAYFQDYVPNNKYDIRVITIDNKAFAIKRMCRANDFRASGSGRIIYDHNEIDTRCVKYSFDIAKRLESMCVGFDWVFDEKNNPLIVEIGYGFTAEAYLECDGYWTEDMVWHTGKGFDFCGWMVESVINQIKR